MCISPSQDLSAGESSGDTSLRLYDRAASIVNAALFENSNNTSVQAFILLGNYAQKLNHPSAGSVFLGECGRWLDFGGDYFVTPLGGPSQASRYEWQSISVCIASHLPGT